MVKDLALIDEVEDSNLIVDGEESGLQIHRQPSHPNLSTDEIQAGLAALHQPGGGHHNYKVVVASLIEGLLAHPGRTWQERWEASGAERIPGSRNWVRAFPGLEAAARAPVAGPGMGVSLLIALDALRPSVPFLARNGRIKLNGYLPWTSDGLEKAHADYHAARTKVPPDGRRALWIIQAATGKHLSEVTADDLVAYTRLVTDKKVRATAGVAWDLLKILAIAPADAPSLHQLAHRKRRDVSQMVEFYKVEPPDVAEMFVRYLRNREPSLDYSSLRHVAYELLRNFWIPIRSRSPHQSDLRIDPELGQWWKRSYATERADTHRTLFAVRALYLDVASWATHDAYWARWAAPSFIAHSDTVGAMKQKRRVQAAIHQRIRHLTPDLPRLMDSVDRDKDGQKTLLDVALDTPMGADFEFGGTAYTRLAQSPGGGFPMASVPLRIRSTGEVVAQARSEERAFWAWATAHILHETGIRIEELLELTATALFTYQPVTGDRLLLLQIVPSKSDRERVLLVSPELAHVLAAVRQRVRGSEPQVPLAVRYDDAERVYSPPLPFLFQTRRRTHNRVLSHSTVRTYLRHAVLVAGIGDETTKLTPHDFRRMFATDALRSGLPVHILSKVMGHLNISTTQGYAAVFDDDIARHFREFVDRRRALRPTEDYREPTAAELDEFQAHFSKRKVELGSCSRGYGTPCLHEHACIRCPMLRPDPVQRRRLDEIRVNLLERQGEAKRMGWLGELEGIEISLRAADEKLAQMSRIVHLSLERRPPHVR